MTTAKSDPAIELHRRVRVRSPYRSPNLEVLGSLRSATRGTGGAKADGSNSRRQKGMKT